MSRRRVPCGPNAPTPAMQRLVAPTLAVAPFGLVDRLAVILQDIRDAQQDARGAITSASAQRDLVDAEFSVARVLNAARRELA